MSDHLYSHRIDYLNTDNARYALQTHQEHIPELLAMIKSEPAKLRQIRYSSLASSYNEIALTSYALGYPLDVVAKNLRSAVQAYVEVFRLRGTEPPFEAYEVVPAAQETVTLGGDPFVIRPLHDPASKDYSLTNSRKNYYAVCKSLIVGDMSSATELAGVIWDPPGAPYLGKNSEVCTPNDQRIAYAMRRYYACDPTGVEAELRGLSSASTSIGAQATMWRGLVSLDGHLFVNGLDSLIRRHEKEARLKENRFESEFFICIPALGLARLALRDGVCGFHELPSDSVYLPIQLLEWTGERIGSGDSAVL